MVQQKLFADCHHQVYFFLSWKYTERWPIEPFKSILTGVYSDFRMPSFFYAIRLDFWSKRSSCELSTKLTSAFSGTVNFSEKVDITQVATPSSSRRGSNLGYLLVSRSEHSRTSTHTLMTKHFGFCVVQGCTQPAEREEASVLTTDPSDQGFSNF